MKSLNINELKLSDIFKIKYNKCSDVSKCRDIIKKKIQSVIKFKISILVWHEMVLKKNSMGKQFYLLKASCKSFPDGK